MKTSISTIGLEELGKFFETAPKQATVAARIAINDTASKSGMKLIKDEMLNEINFPRGYLAGDRLGVTRRATNANLEAVITGRKRTTSLARFTSGSPVVGSSKGRGVTVRVSRGRTQILKDAWLVRLKKGASLTEDSYNIGLAVRLKPGERLLNKRSTHKSWLVKDKVALLYGPSVDQVFSSVADDVIPEMGELMSTEFFRQFARLTSGK